MKRLLPAGLLLLLLTCFSGESEERAEPASPSVPVFAQQETELSPTFAAGSTYSVGPYTLTTPNALWRDLSFRGRLFLVRIHAPDSRDEVAYLEAYSLTEPPENLRRALVRNGSLHQALHQDLRELIEERIDQARILETLTGYHDVHPAATLTYLDRRTTFSGLEVEAYNEVSLVYVEGVCHLIVLYCYAEYAGELAAEFAPILHSLNIKPPPPPVVETASEEVEGGLAAEAADMDDIIFPEADR